MSNIRFGANFAVFVLFFGVAALDAVVSGNAPRVAFWLTMGFFFLAADNLKSRGR